MNLPTALRWSAAIVSELSPLCHRLEVAGSIRRTCPECGDIDIVCIAKTKTQKDLLGHDTSLENTVLEWARSYVQRAQRYTTVPGPGEQTPRIIIGGEREGKQLIVQLRRCQLDIWFATESTWATRLLMRTGSKSHNKWLAQRLADRGMHWFPYEGISTQTSLTAAKISLVTGSADQAVAAGLILPAGNEADLYGYAGLDVIPPANRDLPWLSKHIDSGL